MRLATAEEQSSLGGTESMPLSALEPADVDIGVPGGEQDPSVASQTLLKDSQQRYLASQHQIRLSVQISLGSYRLRR